MKVGKAGPMSKKQEIIKKHQQKIDEFIIVIHEFIVNLSVA
jgi:hypothetical protein